MIDALALALFTVSLARWLVSLGAALYGWRMKRAEPRALHQPLVSVIVPAFNEERVIAHTLRALLRTRYPALEIIVVDDASADGTRRTVLAATPAVRLVSLPKNGGKAQALNRGLMEARGAIIVTVDADTQVHTDAIGRLVAALATDNADAAAGNVKIGNRDRWLTRWQSLDYVASLQLGRRAQAALDCITTLPGALAAFRRSALDTIGGFSSDTLAEDTDATLMLLRAGRRVVFAEGAVAWTEAPATLRAFFGQRLRWLHGNLQCAWKHRRAFVERGQRGLKLYGLPSFWHDHLIVPLLLPLSIAYLVHALDWRLVLVLPLMMTTDFLTAIFGIVLDHEDPCLVLYVPLQRFAYPVVLFAAFVVVVWRVLHGERGWHSVARTGGWSRA